MSTVHKDRFETETALFIYRGEAGLQEMRKWLYSKKDEIADKWTELAGDELLQLQGEARLVKRMIRLIDVGPITRGEA